MLWPMSVGRQWVREFSVYDENGVETSAGTDTIRITGTVRFGIADWYRVDWAGRGVMGLANVVVSNRPAGVYARPPEGLLEEEILFRYPSPAGEYYGPGGSRYVFMADMPMTVGDTTYRVWGYRRDVENSNQQQEIFLSPGTGPVLERALMRKTGGALYVGREYRLKR